MEIILSDPVPPLFDELSNGRFEIRPLTTSTNSDCEAAVAILVYGHPPVDGALMDACPNLKVISNHGVGVDHIDVAAATARK